MCARFTVLSETPIASAIAGCVMPLSRSNTICMRWRCSAASFQRSAVLSSRTSRLVHLTILPPQIRRSQGITSPAPSIGTKLPQTPRFNQLRKRYEMGAFMAALRAMNSIPARALELTILCATRTNETLGARWDEVDLEARLWIIPAIRTKRDREHRVPLSDAAVSVLTAMAAIRSDDRVFPVGIKAMRRCL